MVSRVAKTALALAFAVAAIRLLAQPDRSAAVLERVEQVFDRVDHVLHAA